MWLVIFIIIVEKWNPHFFTDNFILQNLPIKGSWSLSKSNFPVYANFNQFTKQYHRSFWAKLTEIIFTTTLFEISQSQHRIVRVTRGCSKKYFAIKLFQFCNSKTQQRYMLQEEVNISKRELTSAVHSLRIFLKTFDHASKCIQIPLPKPNFEIGSTKSKDNLFAHYYNDIIEHPNRQIRLSFRFGNNNSCFFSITKFQLLGNQIILTGIGNLNHRDIHHLYKNRYYVASKCEIIESNQNV